MKKFRILTINPGGGSTKVALFENESMILKEEVVHKASELARFESIIEQKDLRESQIASFLKNNKIATGELNAIVARGGAFFPLSGGVYLVDNSIVEDVLKGKVQADHPSNLGVLIAYTLSTKNNHVPAFFVDPVSVDEFDEVSRISGLKELERKSLSHALNTKYVAKKISEKHGKRYEELNLIVAHLGTGISISPHRKGKMFDVNNANDGGPFSPQRTGTLPVTGLVRLCFSGKYTEKALINKITRQAGLFDYLGTSNLVDVIAMTEKGDLYAKLIYNAMIYQISKEIGAAAAALKGEVDYIIITGGMSKSARLINDIKSYVGWISKVEVVEGENEMEALAFGGLQVLRGDIKPKQYAQEVKYTR